ncbi:IclR family transcriptional regulator [Sphingobium phenoxybenzoativorans]|uniref:IclR family transcriptional regulator n=1 Tax=Sphingobium phenoxybenzoativorans TaxID=1592790 RepID=UPI000872F91E|nr:IclR family transcriptional regulator [Sphingobium phenoxybenzoativorans]
MVRAAEASSELYEADERKTGAASLDKALDLWLNILRNPGRPLRQIASELCIPDSTVYRFVSVFESRDLLCRISRGNYAAGIAVTKALRLSDLDSLFMALSRPLLENLSRQLDRTVHLGVLHDAMVTYLIKEAPEGSDLFTREGMQLEGYCTGIGKVLLGSLEDDELAEYFKNDEFVALTRNTVTDPDRIRDDLELTRARGFALDQGEVADDLFCVAVPILDANGKAVAAISAAGRNVSCEDPKILSGLRQTAATIEDRLRACRIS